MRNAVVSYCPKSAVEATDHEMKYETFSAFVDELSLPFLEDAEIDFTVERCVVTINFKSTECQNAQSSG